MDTPYVAIEGLSAPVELGREVTTVGRGPGVDLVLADPTVSRLHAELVRRGPYLYVADLGLSATGTTVNGRPVGRRVLADGDVVGFGEVRGRVGGLMSAEELSAGAARLRRVAAPELTRREREVLVVLCRPALVQDAFVAPMSAREVARELVVTEAAVKQHLLRLYQKFRIPEGPGRRERLANEVIGAGVVQPGSDNARRAG
ncbi:MAG TPA: FHA domain-containing protein [Mycobacteriales bacterium]|nr:FHA domain-containing protein [Mycobacteriales bacterium]